MLLFNHPDQTRDLEISRAKATQVLEELAFNKANPDPLTETPDSRKTYTIGDDVITQYENGTGAEHLLYDGHGSTRQLVFGSSPTTIVDSFSYDGYGVMLGGNPGSASNPSDPSTHLLYAGEQFDTSLQMYYNRARYYDQNIGRFNRMDPYAGNTQDPQSLHKYLYAHCNPIMNVDPSGEFSILSVTMTVTTIASISSIFIPRALGVYGSAKQLLDLSDLTNLVRRLANRGVIDMFLAERIRIEATRTAINLIGVIGGQILDVVKKAVSYYAYALVFAGITSVAMGGLKASVKLAKASRVITKVGDEVIDQHHLVLRAAVKRKYLKVNRFSIPRSLHTVPGTGLHSKIWGNSRFNKLLPRRGMNMGAVLNKMGRQQWLDELGECYKWLETKSHGDYKGIYEAYQKAVKGIGGASGLI